jgi:hypothetical protein
MGSQAYVEDSQEASRIGYTFLLDAALFLRNVMLDALFESSRERYFHVAFARLSPALSEAPHCPR